MWGVHGSGERGRKRCGVGGDASARSRPPTLPRLTVSVDAAYPRDPNTRQAVEVRDAEAAGRPARAAATRASMWMARREKNGKKERVVSVAGEHTVKKIVRGGAFLPEHTLCLRADHRHAHPAARTSTPLFAEPIPPPGRTGTPASGSACLFSYG